MPTFILGISSYYHDSAAALIADGELISAAQEERFSRIKHDSSFPTEAIKFCLEDSKITLNDVEYIVFYDKPFIKFERLLETYLSYAPRGFKSFLKSMPIWIGEKLFLKHILKKN
jgi:carbamoyltransferase